MSTHNKKAFTLVELIVVITILAILGTIAFVSLQWYSKDSRNSVRVTDVSTINTSLELLSLQTGKYPTPSNAEAIFSWATIIWQLGTIGDSVVTNVQRLWTKPLDPKTSEEYGYSTTQNSKEFQVKYTLEDGLATTLPQTYAATNLVPRLKWNYNDLYTIGNDGIYYTLPSLFPSNLDITLAEFTLDSETNTTPFTVQSLWNSTTISADYAWFAKKLKTAYSWAIFTSRGWLYAVLSTIESTNTWALAEFAKNLTTGEVTKTVVVNTTPANSCNDTTKPADDLNKTYTVNPTSPNQSYVQDGVECWYTCTGWYTWTNCEIAPFVVCWDTVSAWWETYTTISWPDGNCWTSQNMNHWTMLANWSIPSDINTIEKWCYNNSSANCTSDWWLYTWSEAMWIDGSYNWITYTWIEDTSKSVCWQLWTWWWLPTDAQWTILTNAWATWWTWNKISWIVSSLPGYRDTLASFYNRTSNGYWWSSTENSATHSWYRYLYSGHVTVYSSYLDKANGLSVVCIKN